MRRALPDFKFSRLPIRVQLLLLLLAGLLPAAGGIAWLIAHQREQAREAAYAQVRVVVNHAASQISTLLSNSETMLERLAARPSVRALDARRCDPIFQEQLLLRRESTILGLRDAQGRLICISSASASASPLTDAEARDMPWFREGIANNRFTASDAYLGRVSRRWVTNLTYPVRDDAGAVTGLLFIGVDLLKFQKDLVRSSPSNAQLVVFDRTYRFLLRSDEPEKVIGQPLPAPQLAYIKDRDEAHFTATGVRGGSRLWAHRRMPDTGWHVMAGLPEDEVFAGSRAELDRSVAVGGLALLLMLVLTLSMSRPIRELARTSARFVAGDVSARALVEGPAEVEAIAEHFNQVLDERERTLEALRESHDRFQQAFQASPDSITLVTLDDGSFVEVNDSFERFTGYSRAEVMGRNARDLNMWMDPAQRDFMFAEVRAGRKVIGLEARIRRKDGAIRIGQRFATRVEIGGVPHILSIMRDITDLKRTEEELLRERNFAAGLVEAAPAIIIMLDLGGRISHVNPFFERLTGYRLDEVRGKDWFATFLPERDRERIGALFRTAANDVPTRGNVNPIVTRSGEEREIEWHDRVLRDGHGNFMCLLAIGQDVTERLRVERALRASAERLNDAQRIAKVGNWELDLVGNRLIWSDEIFRIFEIDKTRFGATYEAFLDAIHPEDREAVDAAYTGSLTTREPYEISHRLRMADGRIKHVHERCESEFDTGGKPIRSLGTVQDVTDLNRVEEALRQVNAELEQRVQERTAKLEAANKELETFAYSVSHDLKAPLRGIDGYSRLLLDDYADKLDGEGRQFLQNVRQAAQQMGELIGDLLAYSRLERRDMQAGKVNPQELIEELLAERAEEIGTRGVMVTVNVSCTSVTADRDGLAMALRNLLENALKFTPSVPKPMIEVNGRDTDATCIFSVRDNGVGFDMKFHDRIFDIFQRLHRSEDYPGTGIGLAIVKKAMERMGGRAWAESEPGKGATFYLEIPE